MIFFSLWTVLNPSFNRSLSTPMSKGLYNHNFESYWVVCKNFEVIIPWKSKILSKFFVYHRRSLHTCDVSVRISCKVQNILNTKIVFWIQYLYFEYNIRILNAIFVFQIQYLYFEYKILILTPVSDWCNIILIHVNTVEEFCQSTLQILIRFFFDSWLC